VFYFTLPINTGNQDRDGSVLKPYRLSERPELSYGFRINFDREKNMNEQAGSSGQIVFGWRLKVGIALFVLSIILPLAGIPAVAALGLSTTLTATISGALLFGAEFLGIFSIGLMGKPGFTYIKTRVSGFFKQHGPPARVSSVRYRIGLVMICIPILFAWVSVYISSIIPGFESDPVIWALAGDILLVISLFVLGGDFWDKVRALFIHDSRANFT
jgi:hypothetical protein